MKGDVIEFFQLGRRLVDVSKFFFRNHPDGEEKVLSILGFKDKSDYEAAQEERFQKGNRNTLLDEKVANWEDQKKKEKILELFNSLSKIGQIRVEVFPEWFEGGTREAIRYYTTLANRIILLVLECGNWEDYKRKRRNLHARRKYRKQKEEGTSRDTVAMKAALERDGHRCVITGSEKNPTVHHIDGDRTNNKLDNLITVSREVHQAIHNGARAIHDSDMMYWERKRPQYVLGLNKRMDNMRKYVVYLKKSGYDEARIECILGYDLFELEAQLNIRTRQKRVDGWYNVVVLQPTGHHREPQPYATKTKYSNGWTDEEQKCDWCPHEGDPPCGDFHPGSYCFTDESK